MAFRFANTLNNDISNADNPAESLEQPVDLGSPVTPHQEAPSVPNVAEAPASKAPKSTPSTSAKAPTGTRGGKRAAGGKNSESNKRCQIGFWLTLGERRALRTVCANNDTNITSFTSGAVLDAMRYTYECTSAGCHCQFTLRTKDDAVPAKAVRCPVCGEKVSAIRY